MLAETNGLMTSVPETSNTAAPVRLIADELPRLSLNGITRSSGSVKLPDNSAGPRTIPAMNKLLSAISLAIAFIGPAAISGTITTALADPTDPMQRLLALVPRDLQCSPGTNPVGSGLAEVDCQTGVSGISDLRYTLFPDQGTLHDYATAPGVYGGYQPCPGRGQSPLDWQSAANPRKLRGTLTCYNFDGPVVRWSIDPQLVLGFVRGGSGTTIDQVYQWWAARYQ
jgi:hypothetical protein